MSKLQIFAIRNERQLWLGVKHLGPPSYFRRMGEDRPITANRIVLSELDRYGGVRQVYNDGSIQHTTPSGGVIWYKPDIHYTAFLRVLMNGEGVTLERGGLGFKWSLDPNEKPVHFYEVAPDVEYNDELLIETIRFMSNGTVKLEGPSVTGYFHPAQRFSNPMILSPQYPNQYTVRPLPLDLREIGGEMVPWESNVAGPKYDGEVIEVIRQPVP